MNGDLRMTIEGLDGEQIDITPIMVRPGPMINVGPLEGVLWATRAREAARTQLREAILYAYAEGVPRRQIAAAAGVSKRYVELVRQGERLKARG
jgi:hypothetical protein